MKLFDREYKLIENYYIVGDIAYSKLRLKGFMKSTNKDVKSFNNYDNIKKYINENCAYGCKYFILERENVD